MEGSPGQKIVEQASSELQQKPHQVSSPTSSYPLAMEYVYSKVSASTLDSTGETGEDSGYGHGRVTYVPS